MKISENYDCLVLVMLSKKDEFSNRINEIYCENEKMYILLVTWTTSLRGRYYG